MKKPADSAGFFYAQTATDRPSHHSPIVSATITPAASLLCRNQKRRPSPTRRSVWPYPGSGNHSPPVHPGHVPVVGIEGTSSIALCVKINLASSGTSFTPPPM
ncbi:hypothetical protein K227x_30480 [Rubripirellula lacrimiformis]|uniref:Uncharacterized protein n=1 Tax=Rubripirellula lacrimiformis TaxID=1930273 RepID=A0A517NBY6_9BACT|nr:hypothetical protein K227x_30480 [Rubripirellula lacrimiformis]